MLTRIRQLNFYVRGMCVVESTVGELATSQRKMKDGPKRRTI